MKFNKIKTLSLIFLCTLNIALTKSLDKNDENETNDDASSVTVSDDTNSIASDYNDSSSDDENDVYELNDGASSITYKSDNDDEFTDDELFPNDLEDDELDGEILGIDVD